MNLIESKRLTITVCEDWSSLFWRCNWYDFSLINARFEWNPMWGDVEITLALLGVHFQATVKIAEPNEEGREVIQRTEKILKD